MENAPRKELNELLLQLMEARGVNAEKLTILTGLPRRFLTALLDGDFEKLPGRPYVRGYLIKIAGALDVNQDILLQSYKESGGIPSSGGGDALPQNRFAFKTLTWRNTIFMIGAILVVIYLGLRADYILGVPSLTITYPTSDIVKTKMVKIEGLITPGDELRLNNEVVYTSEGGRFEKEISLDPGLNTLEFTVKRFLGRENKIVKQIFYQQSE